MKFISLLIGTAFAGADDAYGEILQSSVKCNGADRMTMTFSYNANSMYYLDDLRCSNGASSGAAFSQSRITGGDTGVQLSFNPYYCEGKTSFSSFEDKQVTTTIVMNAFTDAGGATLQLHRFELTGSCMFQNTYVLSTGMTMEERKVDKDFGTTDTTKFRIPADNFELILNDGSKDQFHAGDTITATVREVSQSVFQNDIDQSVTLVPSACSIALDSGDFYLFRVSDNNCGHSQLKVSHTKIGNRDYDISYVAFVIGSQTEYVLKCNIDICIQANREDGYHVCKKYADDCL